MQSLKNLREQLGLSQKQVACLLGISAGLVAMVETGKRSLSSEVTALVTRLSIISGQLPDSDPEVSPETDGAIRNQLARKIKRCVEERNKNQFRLEQLEEQVEKRKRIAWLATQPGTQSLWPKDSIEHDEWILLQRKNNKKISALTKAIIFLKISIAGLDAEIKTAEKQISG